MRFFQWQGDVFQGGEVREKVEGLEDGPNSAAMREEAVFIIVDNMPVDFDGAGVRIFQAAEDAQEGRFAAAGRTGEGQRVNAVEIQ